MSDYHFTEAAARRYPLCKAFALGARSVESNPFGAVKRTSAGYVAKEIQRLLTPHSALRVPHSHE